MICNLCKFNSYRTPIQSDLIVDTLGFRFLCETCQHDLHRVIDPDKSIVTEAERVMEICIKKIAGEKDSQTSLAKIEKAVSFWTNKLMERFKELDLYYRVKHIIAPELFNISSINICDDITEEDINLFEIDMTNSAIDPSAIDPVINDENTPF